MVVEVVEVVEVVVSVTTAPVVAGSSFSPQPKAMTARARQVSTAVMRLRWEITVVQATRPPRQPPA